MTLVDGDADEVAVIKRIFHEFVNLGYSEHRIAEGLNQEEFPAVTPTSMRKTFITNLSKSGVSPKMAQSLARHSDINLTMNVYTDVVLEDQAVAVESLPSLPSLPPKQPA